MIITIFILLFTTLLFLISISYIFTYKDSVKKKLLLFKEIIFKQKEKIKPNNIMNSIKNLFTEDYIEYSKPKSKNPFTVLSYNILAQKYLHRTKNDKNYLERKKRMEIIINEIKTINPEIICLQEVTIDVYKLYLFPAFNNEYEIICHNNEGSPLRNFIGIKKNRFELINESKVIINMQNNYLDNKENKDNNNNDEDELNSDDENNANKIQVEGNRGIINVTFRDKIVKNKIINLFCVHFPWRPIYEYQKAKILSLIYDLILRKKIDNVIIAGDFNSIPNSIVLRMIYYKDWIAEINNDEKYINNFEFNKNEIALKTQTKIKMNKKENFKNLINNLMDISKKVNDIYGLRSAYDNYKRGNDKNHFLFLRNHPKYTNYTKKFIDTIDYIINSKNLVKLSILKIPDIEKENVKKEDEYFLPNINHPSDHLKLVAKFEYY